MFGNPGTMGLPPMVSVTTAQDGAQQSPSMSPQSFPIVGAAEWGLLKTEGGGSKQSTSFSKT